MITSTSLRRAVVATAGASALVLGASAAVASGSGPANPTPKGAAPDTAAVSSLFPPGSELQFVAVAPCRIIDTRKSGGALVAGSRVFDATMADYSTQGGKAGGCNIPDVAASVQLNLGAISQNNKTSDIKGWATGTAEPTASLVNYNPSGPVANMVTMPVNASGQFTLKTPGAAHVFADVAGYYVKPLYASIDPSGNIYQGTASGVVSSARTATGHYTVTFNRDVERCAASGTAIQWYGNQEVSVDTGINANPNTVEYEIRDQSNTAIDSWAHISLTC